MRRAAVAILLALLAADASRAAPYLGYAYPAGVQAGRSVRVVVGGQSVGRVSGGWISGDGVRVTAVEHVPNFPYFTTYGYREWARAWIDGLFAARRMGLKDLAPVRPPLPKDGNSRFWPKCGWWERLDELDALDLAIAARDIHTARNPLQEIAAISQLLVLDVVADEDATPGTRRLVVFDKSGASAPHPFLVTAEPHVAEPLFEPPASRSYEERTQTLPVVLDGRILPREKDVFRLRLAGGRRLVCALVGRELVPYVGDAVPGFFNPVMRLVDGAGEELAVADDYLYLPDPVLVADIPEDGVYDLEIRDNLFRGRPDFVYSIACSQVSPEATLPSAAARAFVCGTCPVTPAGPEDTIVCPGATAAHSFAVARPGKWTFELLARRIGSPLDGVLRLCGPDGRELAQWDDVVDPVHVGSVPQVECDPCGTFEFATPGTYVVRVSDRIGQGGPDYRYVLRAEPARPGFDVFSTKSAFVVGDAGRATFKVRVVRKNGFAGAVAMDETEDFRFEPGKVAADADEAEVTAVAKRPGWSGMKGASFTASATGTSGPRHVRVVPADSVEQAFAYSHLLPTEEFRFWRHRGGNGRPAAPGWLYMPVDRLAPDRIAYPHAEMAPKPTAAAINALVGVAVPVVPVPKDADDALLAARFAVAAAHVLPPKRGRPVAFETPGGKLSEEACARAVLAGATRIVTKGMRYADGDEIRVRMMSRALAQKPGNDTLLYVPDDSSLSFAGAFGKAAKTLRDSGYCYDYVTSAVLTNEFGTSRYRTLFVPALTRSLPTPVFERLAKLAESGWTVLCEGGLPNAPGALRRDLSAKMKRGELRHGKGRFVAGSLRELVERPNPARRERLSGLAKVRMARFSARDGSWYFIHNPGKAAADLEGRFAGVGKVKSAVAMYVFSGRVDVLPAREDGTLRLTVPPTESLWVFVSPHRLKEER